MGVAWITINGKQHKVWVTEMSFYAKGDSVSVKLWDDDTSGLYFPTFARETGMGYFETDKETAELARKYMFSLHESSKGESVLLKKAHVSACKWDGEVASCFFVSHKVSRLEEINNENMVFSLTESQE